LQISGTPTFILQDRFLRGYVPLDALTNLVAEARNGG
jgi:protein-disulfide isomerase